MKRFGFAQYVFKNSMDLRSGWGIYRLARLHAKLAPSQDTSKFALRFLGKPLNVALRAGTTDIGSFVEVFHQELYSFPKEFSPKVIVDVGANIGMASLYLASKYPNAQIYSFEPVSANVAVLRENMEINNLKNVSIFPYGLGAADAVLPIYREDTRSFWGCSVYAEKSGDFLENVKIRSAMEVFKELSLEFVDLLKVDCEGAEVDMLRSLRPMMPQVSRLVGEFHPSVSNAYEAMYLLNQTHELDCEKRFGDFCYAFQAQVRASPRS